jgi:hypothetical protein
MLRIQDNRMSMAKPWLTVEKRKIWNCSWPRTSRKWTGRKAIVGQEAVSQEKSWKLESNRLFLLGGVSKTPKQSKRGSLVWMITVLYIPCSCLCWLYGNIT